MLFALFRQGKGSVLGCPNHPWVQWLARRTHRTWDIVIFMTTVYYREEYTAKSTKECTQGVVWRKPGANFQGSSPRGVTQDVLDFFQRRIVTTCVKCLPGKPIKDSGPKDFTGGWSVGTICPARTKIPNSQKESRCSA